MYLYVFAPHGAWARYGIDALPPYFISTTTAVVLLMIVGGSMLQTLELREGGEAVARMVGARPVDPSTRDQLERRLLNVVEEMALASGIPTPRVYVLERQDTINAFAAGLNPRDAGRTAGRDRARVQPHPERRHDAEHPADRSAAGSAVARAVWPLPGRHGSGPGLERLARARQRAVPGRTCDRRDRLYRRVLRPADQGRRVAPARVPGRREQPSIHAEQRGYRSRAAQDRRAGRRHRRADRPPARRVALAHVPGAGPPELRRRLAGHPPPAGRTHPAHLRTPDGLPAGPRAGGLGRTSRGSAGCGAPAAAVHDPAGRRSCGGLVRVDRRTRGQPGHGPGRRGSGDAGRDRAAAGDLASVRRAAAGAGRIAGPAGGAVRYNRRASAGAGSADRAGTGDRGAPGGNRGRGVRPGCVETGRGDP